MIPSCILVVDLKETFIEQAPCSAYRESLSDFSSVVLLIWMILLHRESGLVQVVFMLTQQVMRAVNA